MEIPTETPDYVWYGLMLEGTGIRQQIVDHIVVLQLGGRRLTTEQMWEMALQMPSEYAAAFDNNPDELARLVEENLQVSSSEGLVEMLEDRDLI